VTIYEPPYTVLGMQISTTIMESSIAITQKLEIELQYDPLIWASTQRNICQDTIETPVN
jgi:hypothetical protein